MNDIHLHSYNRLIDLWTDDPDGADGNDLRQTRKPQELPGKFRHSQFIFVSLMSMSLKLCLCLASSIYVQNCNKGRCIQMFFSEYISAVVVLQK